MRRSKWSAFLLLLPHGSTDKQFGPALRSSHTTWATFLAASVWMLSGCEPPPPPTATAHEDLDATAWIQTSAEYQAITQQTYRCAIDCLELARKDPKWSAIPSQAKELSTLPADAEPKPNAVILDVDETVLDNSGYQAGLIERDEGYRPESWETWVRAEVAKTVPGAKTFLDVCRASNVTVFFVTNRENKVESATRSNLEKQGLVPANDPDLILSKHEREAWDSNKELRRQFIASRYRVLLLVGDDFNDFVWAGEKPTASQRVALALEYDTYWGRKWFVLPNPNYGGWERALYSFDDSRSRGEQRYLKRQSLQSIDALKAAETREPDDASSPDDVAE